MPDAAETRRSAPLLSAAAFVVVIAGLRAAQPIVVPFLVAVFLAMICLPPLRSLQERGLPTWLALLVITAVICVGGIVVVAVIGNSVNQMRLRLPTYEQRVAEIQDDLAKRLKDIDVDIGSVLDRENFKTDQVLSLFGNLLSALGSVLGNGLIIVFTLIFMLLEAADLPAKLRAISGGDGALPGRLDRIQESVRQYVSIKTRLSFLTGVLVTIWMWLLDVDFPVLWGLLAFLFNYIPNIGSFIAAVPAVVLAFLQYGIASAIYAALGYVAINLIVGNVLEPRVMGRGLGLSSLVVFVSLIFWGWVLGPIGMLFSVPLTMIVKIVLDNSDELRWVSILLGSEAPRPAAGSRP
ncbi:MAG: AI-2E family transporter [Planctomycetota bacterium]|nr:MAG: AI-2E family transporter [Planctomycetota bacterium]